MQNIFHEETRGDVARCLVPTAEDEMPEHGAAICRHVGIRDNLFGIVNHIQFEKWKQETSILVWLSSVLRFLTLAVALLDLVLLVTLGISASADPLEIYVRNISTIAALVVLAYFFDRYFYFHNADIIDSYMLSLKTACLLLSIAGIVKVIISGYYFAFCLANGNFVMFFYVGEILVWSMISLFAFYYYKRLRKN